MINNTTTIVVILFATVFISGIVMPILINWLFDKFWRLKAVRSDDG